MGGWHSARTTELVRDTGTVERGPFTLRYNT